MASWKARTRTAFGKHVPPPERRDLSSELLASSSGLQDRLEGLQALLKQAQCALQEDLSLARSPLGDKGPVAVAISYPKLRKKQRVSDGLKVAVKQISGLQLELMALHQNAQAYVRQFDLQPSRVVPRQSSLAMARATTTSAADLQTALLEAQETRLRQEEAIKELEALKAAVSSSAEQIKALSEELQAARAAQQHAEERTTAACRRADELEGVEAGAQAAQAQAQRAAATSQRHQEALARQTGDNLVLVLKLRQAEEAARGALTQRDALHAQLQQQQQPWFDQVKDDMEARMAAALAQVSAQEAQLEAAASGHAQDLAAADRRSRTLQEQLSQAVSQGQELAAELALSQSEAARAQSGQQGAEEGAAEARRGREETAAENRILMGTVHQLQEDCRLSKEACETANKTLKASLDEASGLRQQLGHSEAEQREAQAQLERLNNINQELMHRKTEIEWQLVEAVALVEEKAGSPRIRSTRSAISKHLPPMGRRLSDQLIAGA